MKTGDLLHAYPGLNGGDLLAFWCPGCKEEHPYRISPEPQRPTAPVWSFNGDYSKPTFRPSLLMKGPNGPYCHLHITDGQLEFCEDCPHELAGKTVPMVPWDESTNYWHGVKE